MTVVLDTCALLALYDAAAPRHADVAALIETLDEDLVLTPLAVAEMDVEAFGRGGAEAQQAFRGDLARGAIQVRWWADAMGETLDIARRQSIDLTDASLVALAARLRTDRIATLDATFKTITTSDAQPLVLLPEDA